MKECNQCSLCQLSDPTCIMGSGPKEAEIMVINSYATDLDEENGVATIPDQLQSRLEAMGINTEEIYVMSILKTEKQHHLTREDGRLLCIESQRMILPKEDI